MADPILSSPPFPLDSNRTPYISSADSAGKHTVPASNWFYDATTNLWLPVTSVRGLPIVPKKSDGTEILTDAAPGSVKVTGSTIPDAQPLPLKEVGSITKEIILANAVAFVNTTPIAYNLITAGSLTKDQIRQYRRFKFSIKNTHDQTATIKLYDANLAVSTLGQASGGQLYEEVNAIPATGNITLTGKAGGTGVNTIRKVVPELDNGVFSNLIVIVSFAVAPTSGAITVIAELGM